MTETDVADVIPQMAEVVAFKILSDKYMDRQGRGCGLCAGQAV